MPQCGRDPIVHKNHIEVRDHHLYYYESGEGRENPW